MYQALYRKWRPMVFSDVVGQRHVTDTLRRQIETNRLSHAYLFTGSRGTGKTTCAKILAKAANCLNPKNGEPCNECPSCVGINNGSITDVSEIDAASYTGVDNIRQIRDESAYIPSQTRMRVYIIDECHMLSAGANNALLKTLEEPPPHVMFILATTEIHKVPATILSRCQIFTFKRLQPGDIALRLLEIAAGEKITLDESAAALLARLADGALRDAVSMLDQCAASASGPIGTEQVLSVLGLAGSIETMRLAAAIAERDAGAALGIMSEMYSNGKDISAFLNELCSLLRDLLVYKTTSNAALLSGSFDRNAILKLDIDKIRLITMIQTIQDTLSRMQRSQNRRVDAELCIISMCDEALSGGIEGLAARVERLEKGMVTAAEQKGTAYRGDRSAHGYGSAGKNRSGLPNPDDIPPWESAPVQGPGTAAEQDASDGVNADNSDNEDADPGTCDEIRFSLKKTDDGVDRTGHPDTAVDFWPAVLKAVRPKISISQYSHLATMKTPVLQGTRLRIITESDFALKLLNKPELLEIIDREASAVLGMAVKSDVVPEDRFDEDSKKQVAVSDKLEKLIERGNRFNNIIIE